jgi:two-component system KDP operon response regulator KdpE
MTTNQVHESAYDHACVLIVDDDENMVRLLSLVLEPLGARLLSATSGPQALRLSYEHHPDVILLDIKMPDMDGLTVCERLRAASDVSIIMVTALGGMDSVSAAYAVGADDYVIKPFDSSELLARVQACLPQRVKVPEAEEPMVLGSGEFVIDLTQHSVCVSGQEIHFSPTEFRLLVYLARNAGRVSTHQNLLTVIRGEEPVGEEPVGEEPVGEEPVGEEPVGAAPVDGHNGLKRFISSLRRKIEVDVRHPRRLISKHGVGYVFWLD